MSAGFAAAKLRGDVGSLALCVDEKSQRQALDREQPVLPTMPGMPERWTRNYARRGTASPFAALDAATGFVIGKRDKRRRAQELLDFLEEIDARAPKGPGVRIVMDKDTTRKSAPVKAWPALRPRYHAHFTPPSASWIDWAVRRFAEPARKQLQRGVRTSTKRLKAEIRAFIDRRDRDPKPFECSETANDILASVERFRHRVDRTLCGEL